MNNKMTLTSITALIICFCFVFPYSSVQGKTHFIEVSAKEAASLIEKRKGDSDFVILDIRTPGEFQSGHLANAVLIDFYSRAFAEKLSHLDKKKAYLIYCRTGNRSARSLALFSKLKFEKIYHMSNGIRGWQSEGLPVTK